MEGAVDVIEKSVNDEVMESPAIQWSTLEVQLPEILLSRMRTFCEKQNLNVNEFLMDAITEKIVLFNKEKRRRPRL
jgi:hypothetical protein